MQQRPQKNIPLYGVALAQSATDLIGTYCKSDTASSMQGCLQGLYNAGVMIAIAIAFLFAVFGAFKYITGAASNQKGAGKQMITNAIMGLVVIFISGTVLYWINPEIFNAQLILYKVTKLETPKAELALQEMSSLMSSSMGNLSIPPGSPNGEILAKIAEKFATLPGGQGMQLYRQMHQAAFGAIHDLTSCAIFANATLYYAKKVHQATFPLPKGGFGGNGQDYDDRLGSFGWSVFQTGTVQPARGDIVVKNGGTYGHVGVYLGRDAQGNHRVAASSSSRSGPPQIEIYRDGSFQTYFDKSARSPN